MDPGAVAGVTAFLIRRDFSFYKLSRTAVGAYAARPSRDLVMTELCQILDSL